MRFEAAAQDLVAPFHPTGTLGAVTLSGVRTLPLLIAALGAIALFTDQLWTVPFVTLLLGVLLGHVSAIMKFTSCRGRAIR